MYLYTSLYLEIPALAPGLPYKNIIIPVVDCMFIHVTCPYMCTCTCVLLMYSTLNESLYNMCMFVLMV